MSLIKFLNLNPKCKEKENKRTKMKTTETMISLVRSFIKDKLNIDLEDFIKNSNWSESLELCLNLLSNSLTIDEEKHLKAQFNGLYTKTWKTNYKLALGIMLAWIIEDVCIVIFSREPEIECTLNENLNRNILPYPNPTYDIDLYFNSEKIPLEIKQNYNGKWEKNKTIKFRKLTYPNLKMAHGIVFGVDLTNDQVLMFDTHSPNIKTEYIEYDKSFNTFATRVFLNDDYFCSWDNWKKKFINITKCKECNKPKRKKRNGYCHECKAKQQEKRLNNNVRKRN